MAKEALLEYDDYYFNSQIRIKKQKIAKQAAIKKQRKEALEKGKAIVEEKLRAEYIDVATEAFLGTTSLLIGFASSSVPEPGLSKYLSVASYTFAGNKLFSAGYKFYALQNDLFDENKTYNILECILQVPLGEKGGSWTYNLADLVVGGSGTFKTIKSLNFTTTGKNLNNLFKGIIDGTDTYRTVESIVDKLEDPNGNN